ncbi:MAG: hypothetical protein GY953_55265 [bacterium]|nr:hypothetical protein [bacterium]
MRETIIALITILTAATLPLAAESYSGSGTLTQDGKTVEIRSSIAVWDPAERQLRIGLFPFSVNRADVETMRKSGAVFVADDKPSPDPGKWEYPPFAELVIEFTEPGVGPSPENVKYYALHVSWLDRMNHTLSANRNDPSKIQSEFSSLRGSLADGGSVSLALRGALVFNSGAQLSWDFQASSRVTTKR